MVIFKISILTGKKHYRDIDITVEELGLIMINKYTINMVVPYLSDEDKLFLDSGATKEEWDTYLNL